MPPITLFFIAAALAGVAVVSSNVAVSFAAVMVGVFLFGVAVERYMAPQRIAARQRRRRGGYIR